MWNFVVGENLNKLFFIVSGVFGFYWYNLIFLFILVGNI